MRKAVIITIISLFFVLSLSSCKNEAPKKPVLSAQEIDLSDYSSFFLLADNYEARPVLWGFNEKSGVIEEIKIHSSEFGLFHVSYCEKVGTETITLYTYADSDSESRQEFAYNVRLGKAVEFDSKWNEHICQARNGFYYRIDANCFYYDMETDSSELVFDGKIEKKALWSYQFYSTNTGNLLIKDGGTAYTLYCKPLDEKPVEYEDSVKFNVFEQYSSGPWTYCGYLLTSPAVDFFINLKTCKKYLITSTGIEVSPIDIEPVGEGKPIVSFIEPRGFNFLYNCFTYPQCITYFRNNNTIRIDRIVEGNLETVSYPLPSAMAAKDTDQMTFNDNKVFLYKEEEDEKTSVLECSLKYYDCIKDEMIDIYEGSVLKWNPCGSGVIYVRYKNASDVETVYYDYRSNTSIVLADRSMIVSETIWFYP